MNAVVPQSLIKGDRVALVSPAGPVEARHIAGASDVLRQWGYMPVVSSHCSGAYADLGGTVELSATDDERLSDLQSAIDDDSANAILCCRGGYGSIRIIDRIDTSRLASRPKWLIGYSDITAVHAVMRREGVMSLHAPMARYLAEHGASDEVCATIHRIISGGSYPSYSVQAYPENRTGSATGLLTGGNLAVVSALVPTRFNMIDTGDILFIENVGDSVSRVERMLHTLRLAGIFSHINGLVVGRLSGRSAAEVASMRLLVARMAAPYDFPVAFGLPVGHNGINVPLVLGAATSLRVSVDSTILTQYRNV